MSVVNKMLRDLEGRSTQAQNSGDYVPTAKPAVANWVWWLAGIGLALSAYFYLTDPSRSAQPAPVTPATTPGPVTRAVQIAERTMATPEPNSQESAQTEAASAGAQNAQAPIRETLAAVTEPAPSPEIMELEEPVISAKEAEPAPKPQVKVTPVKLTQAEQLAELKQRAQQALAEDDKAQASVLLTQVLAKEPDNLRARQRLVSLFFEQGQAQRAEQVLQQGLQHQPQQPELTLMLARLYAQQDAAQALRVLQQFDPELPLYAHFYEYRAALAQQRGDFAQALLDYRQLSTAEPEQARWWLGMAVSADSTGAVVHAKQGYAQVLRLQQLDAQTQAFARERLKALGVN